MWWRLTLLGIAAVVLGYGLVWLWGTTIEHVSTVDTTSGETFMPAPVIESSDSVEVAVQPKPISILAFGDTMFERFYATQAEADRFALIGTPEDGLLGGAELVVLNLEGVIAPPAPPVKLFDFAFDDYYADLLSTYQVDVVSLANNHSLDQGQAGYDRTVRELTKRGVGTFGHQTRERAPVYTHRAHGQTIGLVGFNLTHPGVSTTVARQLVEETAIDHDYTIAMLHWGEEYQLYPNATQRTWGRSLVDWGADVVIGAHPHVMQGMEVYQESPILWSLGNFAFDQYFSYETRHGLAARIVLSATSTVVTPIPLQADQYTPKPVTTTAPARLAAFVERSELTPAVMVGTTTDQSLRIIIPRTNSAEQ